MKMTWTGEHGATVTADKPDERMTAYHVGKIQEAYQAELNAFLQEVIVAVRTMKTGETRTLKSKPLIITISRTIDRPARRKKEAQV